MIPTAELYGNLKTEKLVFISLMRKLLASLLWKMDNEKGERTKEKAMNK